MTDDEREAAAANPNKVIAGLQDALAFAKGDESKARVTTYTISDDEREAVLFARMAEYDFGFPPYNDLFFLRRRLEEARRELTDVTQCLENERKKAMELIEEARAQRQWQPIETRPRYDDLLLIAVCDENGGSVDVEFAACLDLEKEYRYWAPLPPLPPLPAPEKERG